MDKKPVSNWQLSARVVVIHVIFKLPINFSNTIKESVNFFLLLFKIYFMFLNQKEWSIQIIGSAIQMFMHQKYVSNSNMHHHRTMFASYLAKVLSCSTGSLFSLLLKTTKKPLLYVVAKHCTWQIFCTRKSILW